MGRIPSKDTYLLEQIKDSLDYCSDHGRYLHACCPFHDDRKPSFFVYPDWYRCLSPRCGRQGKPEELLSILSGRYGKKSEENRFINPFYDWYNRHGNIHDIFTFAHEYSSEFTFLMDYVRERGITNETINKLKIGWLDGFVTFPVFSDGRVVGGTIRSTEGKKQYINPPGQDPNIIWQPDENKNKESDKITLPFGIFDAITLYQMGYPTMTSLRGTFKTPESLAPFRKQIIVIPDKGEEKVASNLVGNLGWRGKLKIINYPFGTKDLNDLLQTNEEIIVNELAGLF